MASSMPSYLFGHLDIYNDDVLQQYNKGIIQKDKPKVLENIRVELDTGCRYIVLTPEHEKILAPKIQEYAYITPVTGKVPVRTPVLGPITLVMGSSVVTVKAYSFPDTPRTMIGFEAAAKLRVQIDWGKFMFYIPLARVDQETMTEPDETKPTAD